MVCSCEFSTRLVEVVFCTVLQLLTNAIGISNQNKVLCIFFTESEFAGDVCFFVFRDEDAAACVLNIGACVDADTGEACYSLYPWQVAIKLGRAGYDDVVKAEGDTSFWAGVVSLVGRLDGVADVGFLKIELSASATVATLRVSN